MSFVTSRDLRDNDAELAVVERFANGSDRYAEALGVIRSEEQSVSGNRARYDAFDRYIDEIEQITGKQLNNPLSPTAASVNYERNIDRFYEDIENLRQQGHRVPARSVEDMERDIAARAEGVRRQAAGGVDVGLAGLGRVAGSIQGALEDPLVLATLPLGAPAFQAARATLAARLAVVARTAAAEAAIAGVTEAALIQPLVGKFKGEIGSPYTAADYGAAVGYAALGGGIAGAVVGGIGQAISAGRRARAPVVPRTQPLFPSRAPSASPPAPSKPRPDEVAAEIIVAREDALRAAQPRPGGVAAEVAHADAVTAMQGHLFDLPADRSGPARQALVRGQADPLGPLTAPPEPEAVRNWAGDGGRVSSWPSEADAARAAATQGGTPRQIDTPDGPRWALWRGAEDDAAAAAPPDGAVIAREESREALAARLFSTADALAARLAEVEWLAERAAMQLPPPATPASAADDIPFEDVAAPLRKEKAPRRPETMAEWIARQGGIVDEGGELAAMNAEMWHRGRPGRRRLVVDRASSRRPDDVLDRSPDYWRERAAEAGFIRGDASLADFFDALADDLSGRPRVAAADINEQLAYDEFLARQRELEALGLAPAPRPVSPAVARQALDAVEAARDEVDAAALAAVRADIDSAGDYQVPSPGIAGDEGEAVLVSARALLDAANDEVEAAAELVACLTNPG